MTQRETVTFRSGEHDLTGTLERPAGAPRGAAVFAHCFTCDRTSRAASRVASTLAGAGYAVLRFDFAGLGDSEGEFAETTFTTNLADLRAAVAWVTEQVAPVRLLVGHSLGGAAVLAVAGGIETAQAVAVIGAPATPSHLCRLIQDAEPADDGHLEVMIGPREVHISPALAADLTDQPQLERIAALGKPLLVLHSPLDSVVGVEQARTIFETARHPKSFVSLDGADHLLLEPADADFAGAMIAAWAGRYVVAAAAADAAAVDVPDEGVVVQEQQGEGYAHLASSGRHQWLIDEPESVGGHDTGPGPYEMLLAGLGACTSMTMRMYTRRKGWEYAATR